MIQSVMIVAGWMVKANKMRGNKLGKFEYRSRLKRYPIRMTIVINILDDPVSGDS